MAANSLITRITQYDWPSWSVSSLCFRFCSRTAFSRSRWRVNCVTELLMSATWWLHASTSAGVKSDSMKSVLWYLYICKGTVQPSYLSHPANLHGGLYVLLALISFFLRSLGDRLSQDYLLDWFSQYFVSPNSTYLLLDNQSKPRFPILQETLPWQPNLEPNWLTYLHSA